MITDKIMYKIENKNLINFLIDKLDDLVSTSCYFFEYLLIPREGYVLITKENIEKEDDSVSEPIIGGTLINYTISNILGHKYTTFPYYDIYTSYIIDSYLLKQNIDISKLSDKYSTLFENKLSVDVKIKIQEIMDKKFEKYIRESVYSPIDNYLLWLTSVIIESPENIDNDEIILKNIQYFNSQEGNNIFIPKDYNFYEEDGNILTQTFIWILCGMNDWLEKNIITYTDIIFMNKILSSSDKSVLADKNLRSVDKNDKYKYTEQNLKSAIFSNDFFISDKALDKLVNAFIKAATIQVIYGK